MSTVEETLHALRVEHRDLDDSVTQLAQQRTADQFQLQRLKKRKLYLKDKIARLEQRLTDMAPSVASRP